MDDDLDEAGTCELVAAWVQVEGVIDGHVALDYTIIDSDGDIDGACVPLHPVEALRLAGRLVVTAGVCALERVASRGVRSPHA